MVSVENFYLVLYEHLLKPLGWTCAYAYPFGTRDHLCYLHGPGQIISPRALFHHDQEPIYPGDEGWIRDNTKIDYLPRLLANSEHSSLKDTVCRSLGLGDWYFFYHGFAALDWYRDARFIDNDEKIQVPFLSLNHLIRSRRSYRMALISRFYERNLHEIGRISFHGDHFDCLQEITDSDSLLSDKSKGIIERNLVARTDLPVIADIADMHGRVSANFAHGDIRLRQQAFVCVVNETVFFEPKLHLTEKIFQPIVCKRPFILAAAPGNLAYLRSYGFRTFSEFIDESYDDIQDPDQRMDRIADIVSDMSNRPLTELQKMLDDMQPILDHNKRHFFTGFRETIVNELVDNFNQGICSWNELRKISRRYPTHPDPRTVKNLLLR